MFKLCFIIPTKDRPIELERLLKSFRMQDKYPDQIIIIDSSNIPVQWLLGQFSDLPIDYYHSFPPRLTRQRNLGIQKVHHDIDLIGFLDDDIVLEPKCITNMLLFWQQAPHKLGGTGFNVIDADSHKKQSLLLYLCRKKTKPGSILKNGRHTPYCPTQNTIETEWLCGGATVWKKQIFQKFLFDEWFYIYFDDLDFSYRVSKDYRLIVVSNAQVRHIETSIKNYFLWAYMFTMSNLYFVKKHKAFSYIQCLVSYFIDSWKLFIYGLLTLNKTDLLRSSGHFQASLKASIFGISSIEKPVK